MAASMIAATGREVIVVGNGGVPDWAERGFPMTTEDTTPERITAMRRMRIHSHSVAILKPFEDHYYGRMLGVAYAEI